MKRLELNAKNVIAIILMAVDLFVIVSCGYVLLITGGVFKGDQLQLWKYRVICI